MSAIVGFDQKIMTQFKQQLGQQSGFAKRIFRSIHGKRANKKMFLVLDNNADVEESIYFIELVAKEKRPDQFLVQSTDDHHKTALVYFGYFEGGLDSHSKYFAKERIFVLYSNGKIHVLYNAIKLAKNDMLNELKTCM